MGVGVTGVSDSSGREGVWVMAEADQRPVNRVDQRGDEQVSCGGQARNTSVGVRPVQRRKARMKLADSA